jgi:hypothetical protein
MLKKAIFSGLMLCSLNAFAGAFVNDLVRVQIFLDPDNNFYYAAGGLIAARFSDNDVEAIGCGVWKFEDGANDFGFCQATDETGQRYSCATLNTEMMESIYALSENSFIKFYARDWEVGEQQPVTGSWDGACTMVRTSTQSQYIFDSKDTKGK